VRLALDAGEPSRIYSLIGEVIDVDVRMLAIGDRSEDGEPPSITFELDAQSAQDARVRGQHKLGEIRRRAALPVQAAPVVWVAKLDDDAASSLRFLGYAEELLESEQYEMSVVAAQIHLEVQIRVLVQMAAASKSDAVLNAVQRHQRRWAPHERWLQPILEALYERKMDECAAWTAYRAHLDRRNAIVHAGQAIDVDEARASIKAVSVFWQWLNDIANEAGARPTS
jgi:hypothetical protein